MSKKWPSIRDAKPPKSTPVKHYPGLGYAPVRKANKGLPGQRKNYNV